MGINWVGIQLSPVKSSVIVMNINIPREKQLKRRLEKRCGILPAVGLELKIN
jgi:hypothetical protein